MKILYWLSFIFQLLILLFFVICIAQMIIGRKYMDRNDFKKNLLFLIGITLILAIAGTFDKLIFW